MSVHVPLVQSQDDTVRWTSASGRQQQRVFFRALHDQMNANNVTLWYARLVPWIRGSESVYKRSFCIRWYLLPLLPFLFSLPSFSSHCYNFLFVFSIYVTHFRDSYFLNYFIFYFLSTAFNFLRSSFRCIVKKVHNFTRFPLLWSFRIFLIGKLFLQCL